MLRRSCRFITLLCSAVLLICGCSTKPDDRPHRTPAGGSVLYKGQPVADATVLFEPVGATPAAAGQTDAKGSYQLQTFDPADGAVPGEYKVAIRKVEITRGGKSEPVPDDYVGPPPDEKWLLPAKYGAASTSGLTATVKEGAKNVFTFELSD
jgi:hypothetical protein